ncbi:MAG: hypothetical protein ACO2ZZ_05305 [Cyclobacteriaceae bacterium]|jgi:hypothetical protein
MIRKSLFALVISSLIAIWGCNPTILEPYDPAARKARDIQAILETIAEKGWPAPDTTESGARYIIFDESADSAIATPQVEDIVAFDYIGFSLSGSVFDTSIPEVADTAFTSTGSLTFEPVVYTFSESGWTLRYVPLVSQYLFSNSPSTAFQEAVSVTFGQMNVGDRTAIFLPSTETGTITRSRENASPLYFELTLVDITSN